MKKYIIGLVILSLLVVVPLSASAQTAPSPALLDNVIQLLIQIIQQWIAMLGTQPTVTPTPTPTPLSTPLPILPTYTILPATLPNATIGRNFSFRLTTNIPNIPNVFGLAWAIPSGRLPTGLNLRASDIEYSGTPSNPGFTTRLGGEIYGTPLESGTFNFNVQVSSPDGKTATRNYSLVVR